jgi:hypothetical protein
MASELRRERVIPSTHAHLVLVDKGVNFHLGRGALKLCASHDEIKDPYQETHSPYMYLIQEGEKRLMYLGSLGCGKTSTHLSTPGRGEDSPARTWNDDVCAWSDKRAINLPKRT